MSKWLLILFLLVSCESLVEKKPELQKVGGVPVLNIYVESSDYQDFLQNRTNSLEIPCKIVFGGTHHTGYMRASGAGSRYHPKWSYKVNLNNSYIFDLDEFNLSAQVFDPTMIINTLTSKIYKKAGFPVFESHHVFLRINNRDIGLYPLIERVEEEFFIKREITFYELFKTGFESTFSFEEQNNPMFQFEKKIPENLNFQTLHEFIYALDTTKIENIKSIINEHLDINNYLRYHAVTSIINNVDAFRNNFFLLKPTPSKPFELIPWDFDKAFFRDYSIKGIAGENKIISKLLSNPDILFEYKSIIIHLLDKVFTDQILFTTIDSTASVINEAFYKDPYLGKENRFKLEEEIETLKKIIDTRTNYFRSHIK